MTNAQKWVALFLVLFIILFALEKATKKEEDLSGMMEMSQNMGNTSSQELSPKDLIIKNGCLKCHGGSLEGTAMAPGLKNLSQYWSREKLISYLRNPKSYSGDERFKEYTKKYPQFMPSFGNLDVKDLGKMADYLLELK